MAALTTQRMTVAGLTPTMGAVGASGDTLTYAKETFAIVTNGSGSSINVTVNAVNPCSHGVEHDEVVAVGAGETKHIGPFDFSRFVDASGNVSLGYSATTSVTIAVVRPY